MSALFIFLLKKFKVRKNEETLSILNPLKEKIDSYYKLLSEEKERSIRQEEHLKAQLEFVVSSTKNVEFETRDIVRALKGDSKVQGDWGEMVLKRSLESAGMREGYEFVSQGRGEGIKSEENMLLRPDYILKLPENKCLIIDSKVSLKSLAQDDLAGFHASVKKHINELSSKRYQLHGKDLTPDFVVMFIPIESSISQLFINFPDIFEYAQKKNIILSSPLSILPICHTIMSLWRLSSQNENSAQIAKEAGLLFDKFQTLSNDLEKLGSSLGRAHQEYLSIHKKIGEGRGNLVSRVDRLKELGAKTSK